MTPEYYAEKVFKEMDKNNLINPMFANETYEYLLQLIGIGFDIGYYEGRCQTIKRKVVEKLNKFGEIVGIYESATMASKVHRINKSTITRAIQGGHKTKQGFYWRYKLIENEI